MATEQQPKGVLEAREVATLLGVSVSTVYSWTQAGILPCVRVGDSERPRILYGRAMVEDFAQNGPRPRPAESSAGVEVAGLLNQLASLLTGRGEWVITLRFRPEGKEG